MHINGLNGRVLKIRNNKKKRQILLVYGHHSSLERIFGIAEVLADYGNVTTPDLPGFGGMDSLYKIDLKADFDTLADYLAAFIRTNYKNEKFSIVALSIGFVITTRTLQKYPDLASKVDMLISVAGFTHKADFKLSKAIQFFYRTISRTFSGKISSKIFRYTAINSAVLKTFYRYMPNARHKFANLSDEEYQRHIDFEVELWHNNDVRTYMNTSYGMLTVDLTGSRVDLPVQHISIGESDQYFDNARVAEHLAEIYNSCSVEHANLDNHMPSVIASKEDASGLIPLATRRALSRKSK